MKFNGDLREIQKPIRDTYLETAFNRGAGMISLKCGGGKTVLALNIACQLKKKTIVVCHKSFLLDQWTEKSLNQFIPNAKLDIYKVKLLI